MTIHGSQQLRIFRRAIRDGHPASYASVLAEISLAEGLLIVADDEKNQPPPEAYELIGHNSGKENSVASSNVAGDELRLFIERWERLDEEEKGLKDDKKDVLMEAKSRGYCVKTIRKLIAMRKMNANDRAEAEALLATYAAAIGMQLGFDL